MGALGTSNFGSEGSSVFEITRACLVYSLVPYLGIVFIPFGLIAGCVGVYTLDAGEDRRRTSLCLIGMAAMLAVQIFQWWLLYYVPTLNRQFP